MLKWGFEVMFVSLKKLLLPFVEFLLIVSALAFSSCGINDSGSLADEEERTVFATESVTELILTTAAPETESVVSSTLVTETTTDVPTTEERTTEEPTTAEETTIAPVTETQTIPETSTETTAPVTSTESEPQEEIPFNQVSKLGVQYQADHHHMDSDIAILGNDEKLTVTLTASPAGLRFEDFLLFEDTDSLQWTLGDMRDDAENDKTIINVRVSASSPGRYELVIASCYDLAALGEEAKAYSIGIRSLDREDGKIVYVTPTGEKYHYSADCAGENAMDTTLYDATCVGYEPCKKCAV